MLASRALAAGRHQVAPWLRPAPVQQMIRLLLFVDELLGFYVFILIVAVILSWLVAFDVITIRSKPRQVRAPRALRAY